MSRKISIGNVVRRTNEIRSNYQYGFLVQAIVSGKPVGMVVSMSGYFLSYVADKDCDWEFQAQDLGEFLGQVLEGQVHGAL